MTGELTLSGSVLPIGGLKEKALAAHRAGIKRVIIPKENEKDLTDVPDEVKEQVEFILVETVEDVLKHSLGLDLPKPKYLWMQGEQAVPNSGVMSN
jgi:ATP-dependent Lon protease